MKRVDAIVRLVRDMHSDVVTYGLLQDLLDGQFDAALRHDAQGLRDMAGRITATVQEIDDRRRLREQLVAKLCGADARMDALFEHLPTDTAARCRAVWTRLQAQVIECRRLNARNCRLMTDQYEIMQRVLHGEDQTYAPA